MAKTGTFLSVPDDQEGANPTLVTHHHPLPVTDPWLTYAIEVIESDYGDHVSVEDKSKGLTKFGHNELVGTSYATVGHQPAGIRHETYVSDNLINSFISTNVADTQDFIIEGHTISGGVFTFVTQAITAAGQTVVSLDTPLARVSRCYNNNGTDKLGIISITETDTYSAGVPDTDTKVHLQMDDEDQQSDKAATTTSDQDYWIITGISGELLEKGQAFAEVAIQVRLKDKVFRTQYRVGGNNFHDFKPYLIVPPNSDVRLIAKANGAGTEVAGGIQGVLAIIV